MALSSKVVLTSLLTVLEKVMDFQEGAQQNLNLVHSELPSEPITPFVNKIVKNIYSFLQIVMRRGRREDGKDGKVKRMSAKRAPLFRLLSLIRRIAPLVKDGNVASKLCFLLLPFLRGRGRVGDEVKKEVMDLFVKLLGLVEGKEKIAKKMGGLFGAFNGRALRGRLCDLISSLQENLPEGTITTGLTLFICFIIRFFFCFVFCFVFFFSFPFLISSFK